MKYGSLIAAMLILAAPAAAADRLFEAAASYVWFEPMAETTVNAGNPLEDFDLKLPSETGYGVSATLFLGRGFALEAGVAQAETSLRLDPEDGSPITRGRQLSIMPVFGTLQYHFAPNGMIDPYIGVGAMYVLLGDPESTLTDEEREEGTDEGIVVNEIEGDDYSYVVSAGISVELTETLGLILDAKYAPATIPVRAGISTPPGTSTTLDMNPLMVSIGITWRWGR